MSGIPDLAATYYGFIGSTYDALILIEACIRGQNKLVSRRIHEREQENVIKSGAVFIYENKTSGIKRWTDGVAWSPSRTHGNFLIYRQLVKAFEPGERRKAIKKPKPQPKPKPSKITKTKPTKNRGRTKDCLLQGVADILASRSICGEQPETTNADRERTLIGSLTDSYDFLEDGLVKKTISVTCDDMVHRLVSYYTVADALTQKFMVPSKDPRFTYTYPRAALITSQNFRNPVEYTSSIDPLMYPRYPRNGYEITNQSMFGNHIPIKIDPESHSGYIGTPAAIYNTTPITMSSLQASLPLPALPHTRLTFERSNEENRGDGNYAENCSSRAPLPMASGIRQESSIFYHRDSAISLDEDKKHSSYNQLQINYPLFPQERALAHHPGIPQRICPIRSLPNFSFQAPYNRSHM